jgi:CBS domain containing-hemolysin-like protein
MISHLLERLLGLQDDSVARALGREAVVEFLEEGARSGSHDDHAQELMRNALELRTREIQREMVPWAQVEVVKSSTRGPDLTEQVARSPHSRLIVVDDDGTVTGYVHQLDVLVEAPEGVEELLRPLIFFEPQLPVDRALTSLRIGGHRLAVVGSAQEPLGLVSLKDVVETLSGELAVW